MEKSETLRDRSVVYCVQRTSSRGKRAKGEPYILKGREVVLGRHPKAEIPIDSENIHRKHAILTRTWNTWFLNNHKSGSEVWVNGTQLETFIPFRLSAGDTFCLGHPKTTDHSYSFLRHEQQAGNHRSHNSKAASNEQKQDSPEESMCDLVNQLESMLQEKKKIEKQLQVQQKMCKASKKQEKELDHLARNLRNQLKRQKKEERKLQKQLQARQRECDQRLKREKKLQSQLKKKKKSQDELLKKLRAQKKKHQESMKQKKSLQQQLVTKKRAAGKKKEPQEDQNDDQPKPCSSKSHPKTQKLRESNNLQEQQSEDKTHFHNVLQVQFSCAICSELFVQAHTLGCSHTFCKYCIMVWRQKKNECPICRTKIRSMVHALVLDSFIDQVVGNLSPQMKEHRQELCKERRNATLLLDPGDFMRENYSTDENTIFLEESDYTDESFSDEEDESSEESESEEESSSEESEEESSSEESDSVDEDTSHYHYSSVEENSDDSSVAGNSDGMEHMEVDNNISEFGISDSETSSSF